jgi:hypothetical protein
MASVAEIKAVVEAAVQQLREGQAAIQAARERLGEAQRSLAAALDGSLSDAVGTAHTSLARADQQLEECLGSTLLAVEEARSYLAVL